MMCKSWCELIIAIVVIVFALWENVYASFGKWILIIAGIVLIIHSFTCKKCFPHMGQHMAMTPAKKKR